MTAWRWFGFVLALMVWSGCASHHRYLTVMKADPETGIQQEVVYSDYFEGAEHVNDKYWFRGKMRLGNKKSDLTLYFSNSLPYRRNLTVYKVSMQIGDVKELLIKEPRTLSLPPQGVQRFIYSFVSLPQEAESMTVTVDFSDHSGPGSVTYTMERITLKDYKQARRARR